MSRAHRTLLFLSLLATAAVASRAEAQTTSGHRRLVNLGVHPLISYPDSFGFCLGAHPLSRGHLLLEGCANDQRDNIAWNLAAKLRWPTFQGREMHIWLGLGVGTHSVFHEGSVSDQTLDGMGTAEIVFWGNWIGFFIQLDVGVLYVARNKPGGIDDTAYPIMHSTIGLAFRTPGG